MLHHTDGLCCMQGGICIEDVVPSAQPQPENEAAPEEAEPEQEEAAPELEQPEEAPGPSEQHAELAKAPEPEQATAGAATEHEEVPAAPKQPGRRGRKPAFQKATESAAAEPAEVATATEDAQPAEDHTEAAPEKVSPVTLARCLSPFYHHDKYMKGSASTLILCTQSQLPMKKGHALCWC